MPSGRRAYREWMRRLLTVLLASCLISAPLLGPADAGGGGRNVTRAALPDGFQPEGIAIRGTFAYLGSRVDGDLYRLNLRTGRGRVFSQGPGTPSLGLKADRRGRLFVAGGSGGDVRVVDARSGKVLRSYRLETRTSFINDVVLTRRAAWFTDSENAQLFKLPLGPRGKLPRADRVERLRLRGEWEQVEGLNANGITATPDGRALLVVSSASGELFRVSPRTGRATAVDLGRADLANGDGLLLECRTLFAVQNQLNRVAVVRLDRAGRNGVVRRTRTSPRFDVPTTVARAGHRLYLPNARFTTPPTPETPYDVVSIRAARRC